MKEIIPKEQRLVRSLSWNKVNMWQKSKKQFRDIYFGKKDFFETKEIIFGSVLWNMIETWEYLNEDELVKQVMSDYSWEQVIDNRKETIVRQSFKNILANKEFIKKLQELSFDFWSEMEIKMDAFIDNVYLIWYADNWTENWKNIKEFKTWKTAWTQEKVDNHWQLDFYCLMTYLTKWYLPDDVELIWFETKDDWNGWITVTWKIETFKFDVQKHKERIFSWIEKIPQIFEDIQKEQLKWEEEQKKSKWEKFDDNLFMELRDIERQKARLDEQSKDIKKQIEEQLKENNLSEYKLEWFGSVWYIIRKKWEYNDEVKKAEQYYKEVKKAFESENEYKESKTLMFRINKD